MTKPLLSRTEKLMVFFGGYDCTEPCIDKYVEARVKSLPPGSQKRVTMKTSELLDPIVQVRKKILDALNARADVDQVRDLYDHTVIDIHSMQLFEPFVFDLRIPISTQKVAHGMLDVDYVPTEDFTLAYARTEDFTLAYDGKVLMVAAVVPLQKQPSGILDARDKFEELLKSLCDAHRCAPCLTHQAIVFVQKGVTLPKHRRDVYLPILAGLDMTEHLRQLHATLGTELVQFYVASDWRNKASSTAIRMRGIEDSLLEEKRNFMTVKWYRIATKKRIEMKLRRLCVDIFTHLSDYLADRQKLNEERNALQENMTHNTILKRLLDAVGIDEYTTAEGIDVETVTKVVEHVERELETYSTNSSAIISALLGGIVGSVLGIIASYAIGFLH